MRPVEPVKSLSLCWQPTGGQSSVLHGCVGGKGSRLTPKPLSTSKATFGSVPEVWSHAAHVAKQQ